MSAELVRRHPEVFSALHTWRIEYGDAISPTIGEQFDQYLNDHLNDVRGEVGKGKLISLMESLYYAPMVYLTNLMKIDIAFTQNVTIGKAGSILNNKHIIQAIHQYFKDEKRFNYFKKRLGKICSLKIENNHDPRGIFRFLKNEIKNLSYEKVLHQLS